MNTPWPFTVKLVVVVGGFQRLWWMDVIQNCIYVFMHISFLERLDGEEKTQVIHYSLYAYS
jgi:hypothetical protein